LMYTHLIVDLIVKRHRKAVLVLLESV
jgi:hypothetical protein